MKLDRKEFLRVIGIGGSSLVVQGVLSASSLPTGLLAQPVKIYDNYLRGVQYYDLGKYFQEIKVGDDLLLERFADHQYDRFAVGVRWKSHFLGYLPAFENIVLANLIDAGTSL